MGTYSRIGLLGCKENLQSYWAYIFRRKIERRWKAKAAEIMEQSKKQRAFIAKEKTELLALAHKTKEEDHVEMEKMRESVRW